MESIKNDILLGPATLKIVDHVGTDDEQLPRYVECLSATLIPQVETPNILVPLATISAATIAYLLRAHFGDVNPSHLPMVMGAITSAVATSWKGELGVGTHNFTISTGDTVKTALYTSSATLGAGTTAYSATNEISGTGYSAGGASMANVTPTTSGTTAIFDWADVSWTSSTFTANGSLSYNSSKSNKAIFVIAFGSDQTVTAGTFTIQWPTADSSNAIIRIA